MTNLKDKTEKPPIAATTEGKPNTVVANGSPLIAEDGSEGNEYTSFRALDGRVWRYTGKRARVLAMLASSPAGVTQWDTLPWHTRLGSSIHAMREDGLDIETDLEGKYRHARYRLATRGSLLIQRKNREAA